LGWGRRNLDDPFVRAPALDQPHHGRRHGIEPGEGDPLGRQQFRIVRPLRESRLVDGVERRAAAFELATPRVERLGFRRSGCRQTLERNQIVVQASPAAGSESRCIRRIEEIAGRAAARDNVVPENPCLRGSQNTRSRGSMRARRTCFEMLLAQPRTPGQDMRRAPGAQTLLLRVTRVAEPDGVRQPPARRQDGDVAFEERVEVHPTS
jgi:hypothetical protein